MTFFLSFLLRIEFHQIALLFHLVNLVLANPRDCPANRHLLQRLSDCIDILDILLGEALREAARFGM